MAKAAAKNNPPLDAEIVNEFRTIGPIGSKSCPNPRSKHNVRNGVPNPRHPGFPLMGDFSHELRRIEGFVRIVRLV